LIWSGLAIVFFFALRGIGLIVGASAIFYGYRAMTSGHKLGMLAFVISIVAVAIIAVGWFIRLKGGMQY
jgi:hypothetical protein